MIILYKGFLQRLPSQYVGSKSDCKEVMYSIAFYLIGAIVVLEARYRPWRPTERWQVAAAPDGVHRGGGDADPRGAGDRAEDAPDAGGARGPRGRVEEAREIHQKADRRYINERLFDSESRVFEKGTF